MKPKELKRIEKEPQIDPRNQKTKRNPKEPKEIPRNPKEPKGNLSRGLLRNPKGTLKELQRNPKGTPKELQRTPKGTQRNPKSPNDSQNPNEPSKTQRNPKEIFLKDDLPGGYVRLYPKSLF